MSRLLGSKFPIDISREDRKWATQLIHEIAEAATGTIPARFNDPEDVKGSPEWDQALASPRERQCVLVVASLARMAEIEHSNSKRWTGGISSGDSQWHRIAGLGCLLSRLLQRKLPFSLNQLQWIVQWLEKEHPRGWWNRGSGEMAILRALQSATQEPGLSESMRDALRALVQQWKNGYATARQIAFAQEVLGESQGLVEPGEAWADNAIEFLDSLPAEVRTSWEQLLTHASTATLSAPSRKWLAVASSALEEVTAAAFVEQFGGWASLVNQPRTRPYQPKHQYDSVHEEQIIDLHAVILRGFCWIAGTIEDPQIARALCDLAISCYRKIPGIGPRAVKVGNAAVYALGQMPGRDAIGQLAILRVRVKFGTAQKGIEKALTAAAEREGLPRDEIEEIAVPIYGLSKVGMRRETFGEFTAELTITGTTSTELRWIKPDGKRQKSVPAKVKSEHAEELKELKGAAKDIQKMLPAQRDRIDSMFCQEKQWPVDRWRERYLDHPLMGTIARRVIWNVHGPDGQVHAVSYLDREDSGDLVDALGNPFEIMKDATISLWHPILCERDVILAWRAFFEDNQIRQPFKQAHREVYLLTDAEINTGVYSNRFGAHVLRQHQFNALCAARGWKNKLRLLVDDEYPPAHRVFADQGLRAEFWIEGAGHEFGDDTNESGVFHYLTTDQVRFYRTGAAQTVAHAGGGGYAMRAGDVPANEPLPLEEIPKLILSEVMRDVDLFVGVASVGNNPHWADGGPEGRFLDYWNAFAFGDLSATASTRREILQRLVPRLKIASVCSFTDRFLVVNGNKRTYKIHLGSGNIMMEPNDQYLCIVPGQRMERDGDAKVFLPFEGDRTLAIILSKAFMLADDNRIKDPTVLSQIGR